MSTSSSQIMNSSSHPSEKGVHPAGRYLRLTAVLPPHSQSPQSLQAKVKY